MICDEYQLQVSRLLDSALEKDRAPEVFSHLGVCDQCREFFHSTMHIRLAMRSAAPLPMTAELDKNLLQQTNAHRDFDRDRGLARGSRQTTASRIRTFVTLALLVIISGLFWTTTLPKRSENRSDFIPRSPETAIPNYQP